MSRKENEQEWIGVDLDGTLAKYEPGDYKKYGSSHVGEPIWPMVENVLRWISEGKRVKIFTARAYEPAPGVIAAIEKWSERTFGVVLPITCIKDYWMTEIYDDRAVTVIRNTGLVLASGNDPHPGGV